MSTSARKKAERIQRMKEEARMAQYLRERQQQQTKSVNREFGEYKFPEPVGCKRGSQYKSLNTGAGVAAAPDKKEYTGTYVKGIMESHKSNLLPVVDDEHIVAITQMRRN